jgi:DNA-directed RNA polymerase specialized sigma24 family protein
MMPTPDDTPNPSPAHADLVGKDERSRLDAAVGGLDGVDSAEQRAWGRDVLAALESLLPLQRATLLLAFIHQRTHRDIADLLGISVQSVGALLARSLTRLAAVLATGEP